MLKCPECGKEFNDDSAFCDECGGVLVEVTEAAEAAAEEAPAQVFCPECGQANSADATFCEFCGAPIGAAQETIQEEIPTEEAAPVKKEKKAKAPKTGKSPKGLIIGIAAVVVVAVLVFLGIKLLGGKGGSKGSGSNYAVYIQDKELVYDGLKGKKAFAVTDDMFEGSMSNSELASSKYTLADMILITDDGKQIYYGEDYEYGKFTLYRRPIGKDKVEGEKIDSEVEAYHVNAKGNLVTYVKNDDLYRWNGKDKNKIASDVVNFWVSDDGSKVRYLTSEYDLYYSNGKDKGEKADSEIDYVCGMSKDFSVTYYMKDDVLYSSTEKEMKNKIDSDVIDTLMTTEDGKIYYTKKVEDLTLEDIIENDVTPEDFWRYLRGIDSKEKVKASDYEDYLDRLEEYVEAAEELLEEDLSDYCTLYNLYSYDGKKSSTVMDMVTSALDYDSEKDIMVLAHVTPEEKISLSKLVRDGGEYFTYSIYSFLSKDGAMSILKGGKATKIDGEFEDMEECRLSRDGKAFYVLADYDNEKNKGTLYSVAIGGASAKPETYDEDVYYGGFSTTESGKVIYTKNYKNRNGKEKAELYVNKTLVDEDVNPRNIIAPDSGDLYYYVDWDSDKAKGTLKYSNGGKKPVVVSDDASQVTAATEYNSLNKGALYMVDYSSKNSKGDLFYFNGSKSSEVASDVNAVVPYSTYNRYRGK